jgi:tripartite-type tricarboxylate transporter receptor subunit TctC
MPLPFAFRSLVAVAMLAVVWQVGARAQEVADYPDRPIRLIVPFPPGSGTDIVGRMLAQEISNDWNQSMIVDNRPGASTIIGTEIVAKSPPDGYTMVMASNNHAMIPALFPHHVSFDPIKDFAAAGQVAILPFILVVNPDLPVKSLDELLALARRKPREITYASTGNGTPPHVAGEMLKHMAGVKIVHVPYKGSAAAVADVVAGQVSMMFVNVPSAIGLVRAGKLRALATGTAQRIAMMPELPTVAELGLPGFDVSLWMGLLLPAGTPVPVIDKLTQEIAVVLKRPEMQAKLEAQGAEPAYSPPAEFSAFIASETKRFSQIVSEFEMRVD